MTKKEKWGFILNPAAGNGLAKEYASTVQEKILEQKISAQFILTSRRGEATEIAKEFLKQGIKKIVAIGGDGTFNEVIQPLVGRNDIIFGAIPAGTGNDFIQILGFAERFTPTDWEVFWQTNVIKMDVGKCNDRFFLNGMGLGFDAQVAAENYELQNSQQVKGGSKNKYLWHIIKTILFYKEQPMVVKHQENERQSYAFLNTIANGRRLAGGFYLTPDAIANDGLLNICRLEKLSVPKRLQKLIRVMKKNHLSDPDFEYFTTAEIFFEFKKEMPSHLDGELYFNSQFQISVEKQALPIIYNPAGPHFFKI